jgi:pimeloyl-ACP methyl ester carboxylesterase
MPKARANGIEIEWDSFGERSGEPILLVMGLGAQMLLWDEEFCQRLADRGHWVVRYDNRDVGLSTWFDAHGVPNPMQLMMDAQAGKKLEVPYSLDDMADDAIGLCDSLGLARAHVVGASMGGMIAQTIAYRHPARVKSLVSIMSSTGSPSVPPAKPEVVGRLMMPPPESRQAAIDQSVETWKVISGPGYPFDEKKVRASAWFAELQGLITGAFERIEVRLAAFCDTEAALLFATGYAANQGLLQALAGPNDLAFGFVRLESLDPQAREGRVHVVAELVG